MLRKKYRILSKPLNFCQRAPTVLIKVLQADMRAQFKFFEKAMNYSFTLLCKIFSHFAAICCSKSYYQQIVCGTVNRQSTESTNLQGTSV